MAEVTSIEKVLNSRCSSEFDLEKRHFGNIVDEQPTEATMKYILGCLNTPRFSNGQLLHWIENGCLHLGFRDQSDLSTQRMLHVESGMQHQAVYLGCASTGVGTCILNQGVNGTLSVGVVSTAKHLIMKAVGPYGTGKFTTNAPGPRKQFVPGKSLAVPSRDGAGDCLQELPHLSSLNKSDSEVTERDVSQLLWAARGRTPHLIRMHRWRLMWGMTIPTMGGGQSHASIYLLKDEKLYSYVNWTKDFSLINRFLREKLKWTRGNPTHDIRFVKKVNVGSLAHGNNAAIFMCQNECTGRALWEIGYMLENVFLQARSLSISFESKVYSIEESSELDKQIVPGVVAAVFL